MGYEKMTTLKEIINKYKSAEKDKTFPFSDWHRRDVFKKLVRDILLILGYNPDQIDYDDTRVVRNLRYVKI